MANSFITDIFLKIANDNLEKIIDKIIVDKTVVGSMNNPDDPKLKDKTSDVPSAICPCVADYLKKMYFNDIFILNEAGIALAERGFDYEPINWEISFQATYGRIVDKYVKRYHS